MSASAQAVQAIDPHSLLRLPAVLRLIPVGRSTWWKGVKDGRFPAPVKLGERTTAWRASDVLALIESLSQNPKSRTATTDASAQVEAPR
jgi:predicted DNA-binding transcriptional regulator AlpA